MHTFFEFDVIFSHTHVRFDHVRILFPSKALVFVAIFIISRKKCTKWMVSSISKCAVKKKEKKKIAENVESSTGKYCGKEKNANQLPKDNYQPYHFL